MYTALHVIPLFLKACPGWKKAMEPEQAPRVGDIPGIYTELLDLARYIVDSYKAGEVTEFPKTFNTLELLIREGDEKARELVMMGFIEVLQSLVSDESSENGLFKRWLKEESLKSWNEMERFWQGKRIPSDKSERK